MSCCMRMFLPPRPGTAFQASWLRPRASGSGRLPERQHAPPAAQVSWCSLEVKLSGPKAVTAPPPSGAPPPQLTAAALNLKTWLNPASGAPEIVAASVVHLGSLRMDAPFPKARTTKGLHPVLHPVGVSAQHRVSAPACVTSA